MNQSCQVEYKTLLLTADKKAEYQDLKDTGFKFRTFYIHKVLKELKPDIMLRSYQYSETKKLKLKVTLTTVVYLDASQILIHLHMPTIFR